MLIHGNLVLANLSLYTIDASDGIGRKRLANKLKAYLKVINTLWRTKYH